MPYPTRPYLFDNLFALGSINLLAGMSGGGKTRFGFQLVEEIERYQTLLGFKAILPVTCAYFALDRPQIAIYKTLNSMQCELTCPIVSLYEKASSFDDLHLPKATELNGFNFVIFDGLDCLVSKLTDSREVGRLMFAVGKLAISASVAILGILGTAKLKDGEGYSHPRERIIGSSFWARLGEDIILVSSDDRDDRNLRTITVCPRNAAELSWQMIIENGRLMREAMTSPDSNDIKLYNQLPDFFTTIEAQEAAAALGMSRATFFRCLRRLANQGLIRSSEKGRYFKLRVN